MEIFLIVVGIVLGVIAIYLGLAVFGTILIKRWFKSMSAVMAEMDQDTSGTLNKAKVGK